MTLTYTLRLIPPVGKKSGRRPASKGKLISFNRLQSANKADIMRFHRFRPDGQLFEEYRQRTLFGTIETVTIIEGHLDDGQEAVFTFTQSDESYD